ncbi:MAG: hypothetical protein IJP59_10935 [Muribaculaceae bacterium]|nr:hypothetical protein [Muribaculaceae bacterium]
MAKTINELKSAAAVVRDATEDRENTALRIGQLFLDAIETLGEVSTNAIKGFAVISSTDDLPTNPTSEQQQKGYLLGTVLYVYVGTGGDTLDGKYKSADIKGPQGDPGEPGADGHDGVDLGEVALINDLTTGGEGAALSAEMGKTLKGMIPAVVNDLTTGGEGSALSAKMGKVLANTLQMEEDGWTQTTGYKEMPARASSPIMLANETYKILIQADKPMGQSQWELWIYTEEGQAKIHSFGSTDMSVQQTVTYTPTEDIYSIGCKYASGVQDTTAIITYKIPAGTYHSDYLDHMADTLEYGDVVVLDVSGLTSSSDWQYKQTAPIMMAGKPYRITVQASTSYSPTYWEIWGSDYSGSSASRVLIKKFAGVDMSVAQIVIYTPAADIYRLYCGSYSGGTGTPTITERVELLDESERLYEDEAAIKALQDGWEGAGVSEFDAYYKLGEVVNDTCNLVTRKIGLIVMGQSNADGRIPNADFPATATIDTTDDLTLYKQLGHCLFMQGDKEQSYGESNKNFASRNNSGNWAFDDIVYNAVNQALGGSTDFYVLKQTRGATGIQLANGSFNANINDFVKNGYPVSQLYHFKELIERALTLQPDIDFKAILWHQGEAEYKVTEEGVYYRCLCQIIYWLRGKVGNPKLPFIFGTVPTDSEQYSAVVKADMERVAQDINDCYLVDLGAAGDMIDAYHFGPSTAERLAREMYKIMRQNYMLTPMITPVS